MLSILTDISSFIVFELTVMQGCMNTLRDLLLFLHPIMRHGGHPWIASQNNVTIAEAPPKHHPEGKTSVTPQCLLIAPYPPSIAVIFLDLQSDVVTCMLDRPQIQVRHLDARHQLSLIRAQSEGFVSIMAWQKGGQLVQIDRV